MKMNKYEKWCKEHKQIIHESWDKKIFSRPYDEIVEYIKDRFETTLLEPEYYFAMANLTNTIKSNILYVNFKESPQYIKEMKGTNISPNGEYHPVQSCRLPCKHVDTFNTLENYGMKEI